MRFTFHFYISSMYFYTKSIYRWKAKANFCISHWFSFFSWRLFLKEMAVTLVGVLPISIYVFRNGIGNLMIKNLFCYLVIPLVVYFILRNTILDTLLFRRKNDLQLINTIAANGLWKNWDNYIHLSEYIKLLLFPHPLSWDYSFPHFPIVGLSHPRVMLTLVSVCVMFVISFYILFKNRT